MSLPEQIRGPAIEWALLESPRSEARTGAVLMFLTSQGLHQLAYDIVDPKSCLCVSGTKPVFDEGTRPRPEPWPNWGIVITDSDACTLTHSHSLP
jgi:hypothetical protein